VWQTVADLQGAADYQTALDCEYDQAREAALVLAGRAVDIDPTKTALPVVLDSLGLRERIRNGREATNDGNHDHDSST
jgi:hypothetical protein